MGRGQLLKCIDVVRSFGGDVALLGGVRVQAEQPPVAGGVEGRVYMASADLETTPDQPVVSACPNAPTIALDRRHHGRRFAQSIHRHQAMPVPPADAGVRFGELSRKSGRTSRVLAGRPESPTWATRARYRWSNRSGM